MSIAKKVLTGLLGFAGVVCISAGLLISTGPGLRIVHSVMESAVPGFRAESMTGSLLELQANGVKYEEPGISFEGNIVWDISFGKLLTGRVEIASVELSKAKIYVRTAQMTPAEPPSVEDASEGAQGAVPASGQSPKSGQAAAVIEKPKRMEAPLPVRIGKLCLKQIEADVDGNVIALGDFASDFFWQKDLVSIESLSLKDSSFLAAPAEPVKESLGVVLKRTFSQPVLPAVGAIDLPVDVKLASFALENFTLKGEPDQKIDHVSFALSAQKGVLEMKDITARAMNAAVTGSLSLGLDARHVVSASMLISAELPREAIPTGKVPEVEQPKLTAEQTHNFYERIKEARAERVQAIKARRAARKAAAGKNADGHSTTAVGTQEDERSARRTPEARREAAAKFRARLQAWREKARGMLPKPAPRPPVIIALAVSAEGALAEEITVKGSADNVPGVVDGAFVFKLSPAVQGLPIEGELKAKYVEISGSLIRDFAFDLKGKAVDYAFSSTSKAFYPVSETKFVAVDVSLKGEGSEVRARLKELTLNSELGRASIDGQANWSDEIRFAAAMYINDVNTASIMPESPLKAAGSFVVWGAQKNGALWAKLQDLTILGELRGHSLALTGGFETRGNGMVETPGLFFSVGDNTFEAAGHVDVAKEVPELDFKATIDAPDFGLIDPYLKGSVKGKLTVSGTTDLPVIDADVTAKNIDYMGTTLAEGRLFGRVRSHGTVSGSLSLELTDLKSQGMVLKKAQVNARGSEWRHQVTVKTEGEPVSVDLKLTGSYHRMLNNWIGALAQFKAQSAYGPVELDKAMPIAFISAEQNVNIGKACFNHPDARLCLQNNLKVDLTNQSDLRVLLGLEKFDLAFFEHYLPGRFVANGIVKAGADITIPAGMADLPRGTVHVQAAGIGTNYRMDLNDLKVGFDELDLTVGNTKDSVNARWKIRITNNGDIEGNLSVKDIFNARTLSGTLVLDAVDATLVNSFLSPGETAEGEVYGNLRFAGTLEEPQIYGQTGIRGARLDSTKMPFEMLPSSFALTFEGNNSSLDGLLKTPKGEIKLAGAADWRTFGEGKAVVSAKGVSLRVTLPPDVEFDLTTDVRCEASAELIKLDGSLDLPWARVQVSELPPSTVEVSDDVVRMDRPRIKKKDRSQAIPIESNLFINIGDDVRVEAMGLKARLTGELHVVQDKGTLGLTGEVSVPSGQFKAYGQDLIVRRGEFHFTGAAANPMLDLEAIRNPERTADDVIAGVRITGTADFPEVKVFSDPEMSETEALSYLIRGEGLDPSGDSDNTMITSALINLGLSQGSQVFESLGDAVGISGLGLETEGVGDSSQLVVSGYVLPGLKVKYGVGIFDSLTTLTLRYRVIPKLYVEAVSGVDQALDFLYSFEF